MRARRSSWWSWADSTRTRFVVTHEACYCEQYEHSSNAMGLASSQARSCWYGRSLKASDCLKLIYVDIVDY